MDETKERGVLGCVEEVGREHVRFSGRMPGSGLGLCLRARKEDRAQGGRGAGLDHKRGLTGMLAHLGEPELVSAGGGKTEGSGSETQSSSHQGALVTG